MTRRKEPMAGETAIPGYRDIAEIGDGALSTVYRATEDATGTPVALKILKVDNVHPHVVEAFWREIRVLAEFSDHPNVVTLLRALETADGRVALVVELCRESIAEQVRRSGPMPAPDVTRIGIKIAGALETAHRHGFLHGDMKPQSILVTQYGEPALTDLGMAGWQASARAASGLVALAPAHAAPETLEGNPLSAATDVYGLASSMYQMLTGLAPFAAFNNEAPASVILRIIRDPVRPIRSGDIPIGLSDLLEAALAKVPGDRPSRAEDFAEALAAVEKVNDWPQTSYVVWGEAEGGVDPKAVPSLSPIVDAPNRPPDVAPPRATITPRRGGPNPPWRQPPPTPRWGPSVNAPVPGTRNVVTPVEWAGRGQPAPSNPPAPNVPLAPVYPASDRAESGTEMPPARPVFVDPHDAAGSGRSRPLTRSEHVSDRRTFTRPGTQSGSSFAVGSAWLMGGLAAAALVVVAAILLILGAL